jgi:hypothetical protein
MKIKASLWPLFIASLASFMTLPTLAGEGKLLATAGLSQVEGSGGGGLVPWATLAGYDSRDETSGSVFITNVNTQDYRLSSQGIAAGFYDRVELSYAKQVFHLPVSLTNASTGGEIEQDIIGAKVRLYGDAVYSNYPQLSIGIQHKRLADAFVAKSVVGAGHSESGTDLYLAATKVHLGFLDGYNLVWNLAARATKANELGLLGYGGKNKASYDVMFEGSFGVLVSPHWVVGMEYRQKPDNLGLKEDDWKDVFVSYIPNKDINVTAAWVDLGSIAGSAKQTGLYVSLTGYVW